MTDDPKDPEKELVTGKEVDDVLIAEYEARGHDVDAVTKQRVWKSIRRRMGGKPGQQKSPAPLAAIAVATAALVAVVVYQSLPQDQSPTTRLKGPGASDPVPVELYVYELAKDGELAAVGVGGVPSEATLVFQARASAEAFTTLFHEVRGNLRKVAGPQHLPAGQETKLKDGGDIYGFRTEPSFERERFCLTAAATRGKLRRLNDTLLRHPEKAEKLGTCKTMHRSGQP